MKSTLTQCALVVQIACLTVLVGIERRMQELRAQLREMGYDL